MTKIIRTDKWNLTPDKYQLPILENTVTIYRAYGFHGWVKSAIADRLEQLGQEYGIKIVSVYARGTSSFAYDGTGKVKRDKENYALGSFSSKKKYSIDLSASYNIAARHIP